MFNKQLLKKDSGNAPIKINLKGKFPVELLEKTMLRQMAVEISPSVMSREVLTPLLFFVSAPFASCWLCPLRDFLATFSTVLVLVVTLGSPPL